MTTARVFQKGDRVKVYDRPGTVVYVRFAAPSFAVPESYSVAMDDQAHRPEYGGTIWPADRVEGGE